MENTPVSPALAAFQAYAENVYMPLMKVYNAASPAERSEMLPEVQRVRAEYTMLRSASKK